MSRKKFPFDFEILKFENEHTETGSRLLPVRTLEQEHYKERITLYLESLFDVEDFYNLSANEKVFDFINSYIKFNCNNSQYPADNDINPYKPIIGTIYKEKHSIFDSLLPLGFVLSQYHKQNKTNKKVFKNIETSNIDNIEYDKIFEDIFSSYKNKLENSNPLTNLYWENTMLVPIIEKLIKNGLYATMIRTLPIEIDKSSIITATDKNIIQDIINGKFLGNLESKGYQLFTICKKYNLFPQDIKSIELILTGQYTNDKGNIVKDTLDALLTTRFIKKVFNKNFLKFIKICFQELNLRNDYMHMNSVWYRIYNIMLTAILIHITYLIIISFEENTKNITFD